MEPEPPPQQSEPERVVIRAPQPGDASPNPADAQLGSRTATPTATSHADTRADVPMAIAVFGGVLLCFAPLLPWWAQRLGMIELQGQITGVTTWPGIVCELAGAALVCMCAYVISRPDVELRVSVLAAAILALAVSLAALVAGKTLLGSSVELTPQIGLYLTVVGGAVGTIGGSMMRKGSR